MYGRGPGAYRLPTTVGYHAHDPTRVRNPCYTMRGRGPNVYDTLGPGPAYNPGRVTRKGCYSAPAWTLGVRQGARITTIAPGPGAYSPERYDHARYSNPPKYAICGRRDLDFRDPVPGPKYAIRIEGGVPNYTCRPRTGYQLKSTSPGPAGACFAGDAKVYLVSPPAYTMGRHLPARKQSPSPLHSPGPATYKHHLYDPKPRSPCFTMGKRHGLCAPPMIVPGDLLGTM